MTDILKIIKDIEILLDELKESVCSIQYNRCTQTSEMFPEEKPVQKEVAEEPQIEAPSKEEFVKAAKDFAEKRSAEEFMVILKESGCSKVSELYELGDKSVIEVYSKLV